MPNELDSFLADCVTRAKDAARTRGEPEAWQIIARRVPVAGNGWGRYERLLRPQDAIGVYRLLHQERVLVLEFGGPMWVRRDPRRNPPVSRASIPLKQFVRHKATYGRVNKPSDITRHVTSHTAWCNLSGCTGDADPRVLPLHVFATGGTSSRLATDDERKAFTRVYGQPSRRKDSDGRVWSRGPDHGGWTESLTVAGKVLSKGLHWDVEFERGEGHLYTAHEVWKLPRSAYVNVGPTSDVRLSARRSSARKLWP